MTKIRFEFDVIWIDLASSSLTIFNGIHFLVIDFDVVIKIKA